MHVIKRDGTVEAVSFDKVLTRIEAVAKDLAVNPALIAQRTLARIYDGVKTAELDELAAQLAVSLITTNQDYGALAARIAISNHHKNTTASFTEVVKTLSHQTSKIGEPTRIISEELEAIVDAHGPEIDARIDHQRDFLLDFFGFSTLLKMKYLLCDVTGRVIERPQHLMMRVALSLWGSTNLERAFETYDLISQKFFTHATPTLFNAGTPLQQLSSCYLLGLDDSLDGIYHALTSCAKISKHSGGIGIHIHDIRSKGAYISGTNGTSDGIVPMLRVFNATARYVDQGGRRKGSIAAYLEPWHADVEDFLKLKLNTGSEEERCRDLFYALWIPDLFMERVEKGGMWTLFCPSEAPGLSDVHGDAFRELYERYEREGKGRKQIEAQKLWFKVLDAQIETGTPYLLYKDAANAKSNQKNIGTIKSSNLCVAPETYVLTEKGQFPIRDLAQQEGVRVWNGDAWSDVQVVQTGSQQPLITVHLTNGAQLTCTPYHKFIIRRDYTDKGSLKNATRIDASQLQPGMKLAKFQMQMIQGNPAEDILYPYTHGFFCGDGTYHHNPSGSTTKGISLYGPKKDLIPYLQVRSSSMKEDSNGRINIMIPTELPDKFMVPINASLTCRLQWLAGLLDSDGCVVKNGTNESLQISSIHYEFLDRVRLMLQTLGVQSKVAQVFPARVTLMPDGKGGRKEYNCQPLYRILISSCSLHILNVIGLRCHRLQYTAELPQRNAEQFVTVDHVEDNGRMDDTYCFTEPQNHTGVFNGILTGNCSEIIEYSDTNETAVCNLASLALPSFIIPHPEGGKTIDYAMLRKVTAVTIHNLNRVIDVNFYPTPETHRSNMRHRPVGLGTQGLADVFAMLRLPWESKEAAEVNQRIFEHIYYAAVEASAEIAAVEGPYSTYEGSPMSQGLFQYDLWTNAAGTVVPMTQLDGTLDWAALKAKVKTHGVRNSLLLAPMPTASTSQILGFNETIEPFTSNIYTRRTLAGEFVVLNRYLMRDLEKLGLWSEMMKQQIIARNGSVQGIDLIPEHLQQLYKTAWEIKQKTLIDMAAARGAFICQSQSLNLFVADANYAKLTSMHFYAWKQGLKTGIYYLRTRAPVMAQKFTIDPDLQREAAKSEQQRLMRKDPAECLMCGS